MQVRSSNVILDGVLCGAQGAIVAGMIGLNPLNGASCLSGVDLIERVFARATQKFVPGSVSWLGPIPVGLKNIVSYSLATLTTMKVMQLAGLISSIPFGVQIMGAISALVLVGSYLRVVVANFQKPLKQQLQEHVDSPVYANKVFSFTDEGKTYKVRIIVNPEKKTLRFHREGMTSLDCTACFMIACHQPLSQVISQQISYLLGGASYWRCAMPKKDGSPDPFSYTASPEVI